MLSRLPLKSFVLIVCYLSLWSTFAEAAWNCQPGKSTVHRVRAEESFGQINVPSQRRGGYRGNQYCQWLITAPSPNHVIYVEMGPYSVSDCDATGPAQPGPGGPGPGGPRGPPPGGPLGPGGPARPLPGGGSEGPSLAQKGICKCDYMAFHDGTDICAPLLHNPICMSGSNLRVRSSGRNVLVIFNSDDTGSTSKLSVRYRAVLKNDGDSNIGIGPPLMLLLLKSARCNVTINNIPGRSIAFRVVATEGLDCGTNYASIYTGADSVLVPHLCYKDVFRTNLTSVSLRINARLPKGAFLHISYGITRPFHKVHRLSDFHGNFSVSDYEPYHSSHLYDIYAWHVQLPVGREMTLAWQAMANMTGFLIVKEGRDDSVMGKTHVMSTASTITTYELWPFNFLQYLETAEREELFKPYTLINLEYFECFVIVGVSKTQIPEVNFAYNSTIVTESRNIQLCKDYAILGMIPRNCASSPSPVHLEPEEIYFSLFTGVVENDLQHIQGQFCFQTNAGSHLKITYEAATSTMYHNDNCKYDGLSLKDAGIKGDVIMGPFCSPKTLDFISSSSEVCVFLFRKGRLAGTLFPSLTVNVASCSGVFIYQPLPANPSYDISGSQCVRLQRVFQTPNAQGATSVAVRSSASNVYIAAVGTIPEVSTACKQTFLTTSKRNISEGVEYTLTYDTSCVVYPSVVYVQLQTTPLADCHVTRPETLPEVTLLVNQICGYGFIRYRYRIYSEQYIIISDYRRINTHRNNLFSALRKGETYYKIEIYGWQEIPEHLFTITEDVLPETERKSLLKANANSMFDPKKYSIMHRATLYKRNSSTLWVGMNTVRTDKVVLTIHQTDILGIVFHYKTQYRSTADQDQSNCPVGFLQHQQHCYRFSADFGGSPRTWQQARLACYQQNSTLLSINSQEEMRAIRHFMATAWARQIFSKKSPSIYIGLERMVSILI